MSELRLKNCDFFLGFICKLLHNCEDLFHFYLKHIYVVQLCSQLSSLLNIALVHNNNNNPSTIAAIYILYTYF